jgi:hypothetical protein
LVELFFSLFRFSVHLCVCTMMQIEFSFT